MVYKKGKYWRGKKHAQSKQRGRTLEMFIEDGLTELSEWKRQDFCGIRLAIEQIRGENGPIRIRKQPADFIVITQNQVWLFDAKECSQKYWYPQHGASEHQREAIAIFQKMGWRAGFVIWFRKDSSIDYAMMFKQIRWIENFSKRISIDDGVPFDWDLFQKIEYCRKELTKEIV